MFTKEKYRIIKREHKTLNQTDRRTLEQEISEKITSENTRSVRQLRINYFTRAKYKSFILIWNEKE